MGRDRYRQLQTPAGPAEVFTGALCLLTPLSSPPFTFPWIMRTGRCQLS